MMTSFADLHTHTSASDGSATPRELARIFLNYDLLSLDEVLEGLAPEPEFLARLGTGDAKLMERAKAMHDVATHLRTIGKTDHNTLLGTEEMLDELTRLGGRERDKRLVVGTEITANHEFPHIGQYSLHLLVYFHDTEGFDLLARTEGEAKGFIEALRDDYIDLLNRVIAGLNTAWLNEKREKANEHFRGQIPPITEEELKIQSKARAAQLCDPASIINTKNHLVKLEHTDIAEVLYARGIGQSPQAVADEYFTRNGPLYVPFKENQLTVPTEEIIRELRARSRKSRVKAKIGLAHPATYVRVIARKIEGDDFYRKRGVEEAFSIVGAFIDGLAKAGGIAFTETDYPQYLVAARGDTEKDMRDYISSLTKEREFTAAANEWARQKAAELGIKGSGGSDTHTRAMTPRLGYGFGELAFPDENVDLLFQH